MGNFPSSARRRLNIVDCQLVVKEVRFTVTCTARRRVYVFGLKLNKFKFIRYFQISINLPSDFH